jgi:hypothetical protein
MDPVGRGRVRVRLGARVRPARDPRPWRRARAQTNATAATRADLAEMRMPHDASKAPDDPRVRHSLPEEFPHGRYGMAPDAPPAGRDLGLGQRATGHGAEPFAFTPHRHHRAYGPITGTVAYGPPSDTADEPSD